MTLFEFIDKNIGNLDNEYVQEPEFKTLYVRMTHRIFNNKMGICLDIATVEAKIKGKGTFKNLIKRIQFRYPELWIFIENVQSLKFARGLERLGFERDTMYGSLCYYLQPNRYQS